MNEYKLVHNAYPQIQPLLAQRLYINRTFNMKTSHVVSAAACAVCIKADYGAPMVSSDALQALIDLDELRQGAQQLQNFAYAYPERNRVFGGQAHNDTVNFLAQTLEETGYYDVVIQPFVELYSGGDSSLTIGDKAYNQSLMTYTPSGQVEASIVLVNNLGCEAADFPSGVSGNIALIKRGTCDFSSKSKNAKAAGAAAAIVYNNVEGSLAGTLGGVGDYVPTVGTDKATGEVLLGLLSNGTVTPSGAAHLPGLTFQGPRPSGDTHCHFVCLSLLK